MKAKTKAEIRELLRSYHNFSECIIEDMRWRDYATTLDVMFNYIWDGQEGISLDPKQPELVVVRFKLVQEFRLNNALNSYMCAHPEELNWGLNEVAMVKISDDDAPQSYPFLPISFNHVILLWEGERKIDILFSEMEILQKPRLALNR